MVKINDQYLKIQAPEITPRVARRLPPALALRYHALPLAEDSERITVAMANPTDVEAREAILTALKAPIHIVQVDGQVINGAILKLWPEWFGHPQRLLVWTASDEPAALIQSYANDLADMLEAQLDTFETEATGLQALKALAAEAKHQGSDLVILAAPDEFLFKRVFSDVKKRFLINQAPFSLLIARQPRLPLKRLLLVLRSEEIKDWAAVEWAVRIARVSGASITVLPIIPPVPHLYDGATTMQHSLPALLSTDTSLGREMRRVAHLLVDWEINGTLRLRDEPPYWQICSEVAEGDYDLVLIAAEPHHRLMRWLQGEMVNPLLCWADRPVLIANPIRSNPPDKSNL